MPQMFPSSYVILYMLVNLLYFIILSSLYWQMYCMKDSTHFYHMSNMKKKYKFLW
uniref:ATP synthase F0 subunit 8 n=1 Tax=Eomenopon denticulatum TaxID=2965267 RepID=UPI0026E2E764|nr:ATP synthase F0 subunit 8 [Eomenopon denticulatum]WIM51540.1 ATP synthase subunit 8 [Eomenopon denticulatum]